MNYYRIEIRIKSLEGETHTMETFRNFFSDSEAFIYSSGFADGFASLHGGVVLEKQIEKLNDDRSLSGRAAV